MYNRTSVSYLILSFPDSSNCMQYILRNLFIIPLTFIHADISRDNYNLSPAFSGVWQKIFESLRVQFFFITAAFLELPVNILRDVSELFRNHPQAQTHHNA